MATACDSSSITRTVSKRMASVLLRQKRAVTEAVSCLYAAGMAARIFSAMVWAADSSSTASSLYMILFRCIVSGMQKAHRITKTNKPKAVNNAAQGPNLSRIRSISPRPVCVASMLAAAR